MHPLVMASMSGGHRIGVFTITNRTVNSEDSGGGADHSESGVRFNADGTIDEKIDDFDTGPVYGIVNSATDWVIPNGIGGATHYIRATQVSYDVNVTTPAVIGVKNGTMATWITLGNGQSREWSIDGSTNSAGEGSIIWVIDFDIATDSGGTNIVASGTYTLRCLPLGP